MNSLSLLIAALTVAVALGCNPSASPNSGVEETYTQGDFSMLVIPSLRWTGPLVSKRVITSDLNKMVGCIPPSQLIKFSIDAITEEFKLPQETVNPTVDSAVDLKLGVIVTKCTDDDAEYGVDGSGYVKNCTSSSYLVAPITGTITSSMAATQRQWDYLAYKLQQSIAENKYAIIDGVLAIKKRS